MKYFSCAFLVFLFLISCAGARRIRANPETYDLIPCESNDDCPEIGECKIGFCRCNGTSFCEDNTVDLKVTKVGESCKKSADCNINNSVCNKEKKCVCEGDLIPSENFKKCLKVSGGIGDSCEENVQCVRAAPHTECRENKCVCHANMHEHNGTCYTNVNFGGYCEFSAECSHLNFSRCVNTKCSCVSGYLLRGSKCEKVAESVNSPCTENIQCTARLGSGSYCLEKFCTCKDIYHFKRSINKCVRDQVLGEFCSFHSDCHQPGPEPSRLECILGVCKCRSVYEEYEGYCLSSATNFKNNVATYQVIGIIYLFILFLNF